MGTVRKAGVLVVGWVLVLAGLAALVLPGPGLLLLFAGMALLSTEYAWARTRVDPVKRRALKTAADSVQTKTRIALSIFSSLLIVLVGAAWGVNPQVPEVGPIGPRLPFGGWATGSTLVLSGFIALALVMISIVRFREPKKSSRAAAE